MTLSIHTQGLTRHFAGGFGVTDLDLAVPVGAIYGFLGPNGAGKTTTIRLLLGLLRPMRGTIELHGQILDRRHRQALAQVGALVESPSLYPHLTGRQNLEVTRRLIDVPVARIGEALAITDMGVAADRNVRDYSLGMRQRLAIALTLLGRPRLLILDEPANGLDPAGILDMRQLLRRLTAEYGISVFVSSHQLGEIEQVASHIGVLHEGRLRFQGTIAAMRTHCRTRLQVHCADPVRATALLEALGENVEHAGSDGHCIAVAPGPRDGAEINRLLVQSGIGVSRLAHEQASLETFFFNLTRSSPSPVAQATA